MITKWSRPFFWRGVNRRQEANRDRHDLKERGRSLYAKPPNKSAGGNAMRRDCLPFEWWASHANATENNRNLTHTRQVGRIMNLALILLVIKQILLELKTPFYCFSYLTTIEPPFLKETRSVFLRRKIKLLVTNGVFPCSCKAITIKNTA